MIKQIRFTSKEVPYITIYGCQKCQQSENGLNFIMEKYLYSNEELLEEFQANCDPVDDSEVFKGGTISIAFGAPLYGNYVDDDGNVMVLEENKMTFNGRVLYDAANMPAEEPEVVEDDTPYIEVEDEPFENVSPEDTDIDFDATGSPETVFQEVVVQNNPEPEPMVKVATPEPVVKTNTKFRPTTEFRGNANNDKLNYTIGQDYSVGVYFSPRGRSNTVARPKQTIKKPQMIPTVPAQDSDDARVVYTQPLQERTVRPVNRTEKLAIAGVSRTTEESAPTPLPTPSIFKPARQLNPTPFVEPEPEQPEPEIDEKSQIEKELQEQKKRRKEEFRKTVDPAVAEIIGDIPIEMLGSIVEYTNAVVDTESLAKQRAIYCVDHRWKKQGNWFCVDVIPDKARYFFNSKRNVSMQIEIATLRKWKEILDQ